MSVSYGMYESSLQCPIQGIPQALTSGLGFRVWGSGPLEFWGLGFRVLRWMELSMLPDKIEAKSRGSCAPMHGTRPKITCLRICCMACAFGSNLVFVDQVRLGRVLHPNHCLLQDPKD